MAVGTFAYQKVQKLDKRCRNLVRFWLDSNVDMDLILLSEIDALKTMRKFQSTVRDALRLIIDLRSGNLDVLRLLFPGIILRIETEYAAKVQSPVNAEFAQILKQVVDIQEKLVSVSTSGAQPLTPRNTPNHFDTSDKMVDALPSMFAPVEKVDASESRKNFAGGLGDLFGDDDEWDD